MKAIIYNSYGKLDVLQYSENIEKPTIGPGKVLVNIKAAALNPVDCEMRKGMLAFIRSRSFPKIPGSDFAGIIAAVGKGVSDFKEGDEVYGMSKTRIGGSYAEYISISAKEIGHKPANISMEEAASIPLAALTSLQAMRNLANLTSGQSVLINGASGGVGVFALQLGRVIDVKTTAICSFRNVVLVKQLGADEVIDYTKEDFLKLDQKFDLFYDVYGNKSLKKTRHLIKKGGTYVSTIPRPSNFKDQYLSSLSNKKGKVVIVNSNTADLHYLKLLIEENKIKPVIDRVYDLSEAKAAQEYLETRRAKGKIVLKMNE